MQHRSYSYLKPDLANLKIYAKNGTRFTVGVIARDEKKNLWGLTSRRHFFDVKQEQVSKVGTGLVIARYRKSDNHIDFGNDAASALVRIRFEQSEAVKFRTNLLWPSSSYEPIDALGSAIYSIGDMEEIGKVKSVKAPVNLRFPTFDTPIGYSNAIEAHFFTEDRITKGSGGSVLVDSYGKVIGICIAYSKKTVIAAPINEFLQAYNMQLFRPIYANWSEIPFALKQAKRKLYQLKKTASNFDLGQAPDVI